MFIHRIYKAIPWKMKRVFVIPRQLINTIAYGLCNKNKVIVVNAAIFQFLGRVRHHNIGDDLNYYLIKELSGKKVFALRSFYHIRRHIVNIMAIGSVIDWMGNNETVVWGAGMISSHEKAKFQLKKVCAVRGHKTRDILLKSGVDCPEIYGDPALLLPYVYAPKVDKIKGRIGFIPHYSDMKDANLIRLMKELGEKSLLIRVQDYKNWKEVVNQILSCEFIVSTSLHGLILADAYDVPNQWIMSKNSGRFKFEDYYSSVGKDPIGIEISDVTRIGELWERKKHYKSIVFDPKPLLKACPFEISHPTVLGLLGNL